MTSPARYSAGTAFLEIVPSFRGVQNAIGRELRKMESALGKDAGEQFGKEFEQSATRAVDKALRTSKDRAAKHGGEAGDEYAGNFAKRFGDSLKGVDKEMRRLVERNYKIDVSLEDKPVRKQFNDLRREIRDLSKAKIGVDVEAGPAMIQLQAIEQKLRDFQDKSLSVDVRANIGAALAQIETFRKAIERDANLIIEPEIKVDRQFGIFEQTVKRRLQAALSNFPPIEFDADVTPAQEALMELRARLVALSDKRIGIDIGASEALAEMENLRVELATLAKDENVEVNVRTDSAGAAAELVKIRALAELVDKTKIDIDVDVDTDRATTRLQRLQAVLSGSGNSGQNTANNFRAFNAVILAGAATLPAIVPLLGAAAGALALIGPLAVGGAAGLAVLAAGFSGLGDAVSAITKNREQAGKEEEAYAKRVRSASRSVQDATRSVADARRNAGEAAQDAARRVADAVDNQQDAEEGLVRAQRDVVRAQEEVTEARERAAERIRDLALQVEGGALAERRAVLRLAEAQTEYNNAVADPGATVTEREELLLSLQEQDLSLRQIRNQNRDLAAEQDEANRTGVEGSDEVVSAQERVTQAREAEKSAQERVADAAVAVADAVAAASRSQVDSARAIEDAQRNLAEAQEDYTTAITETSASAEALEIALGKLGPAGQAFAYFVADTLLPAMSNLRNLIQSGMFPGLQAGIEEILTKNGPLLAQFAETMGTTLGSLFRQLGELMTSPQWQDIWATFNQYAPIFTQQLGDILFNTMTFFGELFQALAPYAKDFGDALVNMTEAMAEWAAALPENQAFQDFMAWLFENGGGIWDDLKSIFSGVLALLVALEPYGQIVLDILAGIGDWLAGMDPQVLGTITTLIIGLVIAFQLATGALALFATVLGLIFGASGIGLIIFLVAAVVAAFIALYANSETFRNVIDTVFSAIGAVFIWLWEEVLKPGLEGLGILFGIIGDGIQWVWDQILGPLFEMWGVVFGHLMDWLALAWNEVGQPIFELIWSIISEVWGAVEPIFILFGMAFAALWGDVMWVWEHVGKPIFDALIAITLWLWENVFDPVMGFILEAFGNVMDFFASAWNTVGKPIFDLIEAVVEGLIGVFQGSFDGIKGIWDALLDVLMSPIVFVVETVLNNGLIAGINHIAGIFTDDEAWIDPIPTDWIPGRATGGPIPGSSPHKRADNVLIRATAGEYMQQVDAVDYWGMDFMDAVNQRNMAGVMGMLQGRAYGGLIDPMWNAVRAQFPQARMTSNYRPGDPGFHGRRQAIDIGGSFPYPNATGIREMLQINRWIANTFPNITQLIHSGAGGINLLNGRPHQYAAGTVAEHFNHVHWAMDSLANILAAGQAGALAGMTASGSASVSDPWYQRAWDFVTSPIDTLMDIISDSAGDLANSRVGELLLEVPKKVATSAVDAILDFIGFGDDGEISAARPFSFDGGDGTVRGTIQAAAAERGWGSGAQLSALNWIIQRESGFDPNAQNPTSTASGLFQHINATWNAYKPAGVTATRMRDADVNQQVAAGMAYIAGRYGSPVEAQRFWQTNGYYADGGPIGASSGALVGAGETPTLYDTGGWLPPGITTVLNATDKPEPILTGDQWDELTGRGGSGGGDTYGIGKLEVTQVQSNAAEVIDEVNHWVGVYTGGGRYGPED